MYPNPTTSISPHEHFARGAIGVAYKRFLGTHRSDDNEEAKKRFADIMTDNGTETFVGKTLDDIVAILEDRTTSVYDFARAVSL